MGFADGVADAMLAGQLASAQSQGSRAVADLDDARRQHRRDMDVARQEIGTLRSTVSQLQEERHRHLATSLCAQSVSGAIVLLLMKAEGKDEHLEIFRAKVAAEAKRIMETHDLRYREDPHWVSLVERCKTMPFNEHIKVV